MIELRLLTYLGALDIPVYMEMPENFAAPLIIIEKTSGSRVGPKIYAATFAVQCYDETLFKTAELAYRVRDLMEDFGNVVSICKCKLNAGPYEFNHSMRREYRYQLVYDVTYYEE